MTALSDREEAAAPEVIRPRLNQLLVALSFGEAQIGVLLDAAAPVSRQAPALVDLVNARLAELGEAPLGKEGRGRWALCRVDGTPLRTQRSLTEQGVRDGAQLWLRFVPDTEARAQVIEHVTTAMAAELRRRWPAIDPLWAARVGAAMLATAVLVALAVVLRWRYSDEGLLAAVSSTVLAATLWGAAVVVSRRPGYARQIIMDALCLAAAASTALAAAAGVPGPLGAPHVAAGFAVVLALAVMWARFTGRHLTLCTVVVVLASGSALAGLARMLWVSSGPTILAVTLLVGLLGMHMAPGLARRASHIRLPVYPSSSGKWVFEHRPDLPSQVVVASGEGPGLTGPDSVSSVAVDTDRAHSFQTGLLLGSCTLILVACAGLCDPAAGRRWLPLVLTGFVAVAVLLRGRTYTDRVQATIFPVTAVAAVTVVALRYALVLWTPLSVLAAVAVVVVVPAAGLAAAVVVPNRIYTPSFRFFVEAIEYLSLVVVFPLAFWVMDVYSAIRYR